MDTSPPTNYKLETRGQIKRIGVGPGRYEIKGEPLRHPNSIGMERLFFLRPGDVSQGHVICDDAVVRSFIGTKIGCVLTPLPLKLSSHRIPRVQVPLLRLDPAFSLIAC